MKKLIHKKLYSNYFSKRMLSWNRTSNTRTLPWKGEKDPYKIWLSEIILQQTRVEQGLKYYEKFIFNFPNINMLARAPENKVFKLWEGLGYYSRCRNLIATARKISIEQKGKFPSTYEDILKLKGIGPYTAAAIASFAFHLPYAVVDGNVFRVLARVLGIETPIDGTEGKKLYTQLANNLLPQKHPGEYNQAIMDFGATVCKPMAPLCGDCIYQKECVALNTNRVNVLPVKEKKIRQKTRFFYFFVIEYNNTIFVRERSEKDIWRHLHEFPVIETGQPEKADALITTASLNGWFQHPDEVKSISETLVQKLTHQTIKGVFIIVKTRSQPSLPADFKRVKKSKVKALAFPKLINTFLNGQDI